METKRWTCKYSTEEQSLRTKKNLWILVTYLIHIKMTFIKIVELSNEYITCKPVERIESFEMRERREEKWREKNKETQKDLSATRKRAKAPAESLRLLDTRWSRLCIFLQKKEEKTRVCEWRLRVCQFECMRASKKTVRLYISENSLINFFCDCIYG